MVGIALFLVCILCVSLQKAYRHLGTLASPDAHSRANRNLYITLKHAAFVDALLETVLVAVFALFVIDIAFSWSTIWSFLAIFASLIAVFILLPKPAPRGIENKLAELLTKPLAYFLRKLEKPITTIEKLLAKAYRNLEKVEPLSREAIKQFLKEQTDIAGADSKTDLLLALAGLELNSAKAGHVMVRRQKAKFVGVNDEVGPILLSELHDTGRKIFPAENEDSEIVGTVRLDALSELKSGGKVEDTLNPQMVVINKNAPALSVISRFIDSASELVFAEDDSSETVGIIYLEDVLITLADAADENTEPLE